MPGLVAVPRPPRSTRRHRRASVRYWLLDLAARGACEAALAQRLTVLLDAGQLPDLAGLTSDLAPTAPTAVLIPIDPPDLAAYDALLGHAGRMAVLS